MCAFKKNAIDEAFNFVKCLKLSTLLSGCVRIHPLINVLFIVVYIL